MIESLKRFVVANVLVTFVTNHADDVVAFIHSVTGAIHIVTWFGPVYSEKRLSLNVLWNGNSGKIQHGGAQVD